MKESAQRFSFTDEQTQFREVLRRFLRDHSDSSAVREQMSSARGYDPVLWRRLADELALTGLVIPERFGGSGFGPVEHGIALEEMGRALLCAPYFASTVLAAQALLNSGDDAACAAYLPAIASGECIATLAFAEHDGRWSVDAVATSATAHDGGARLNGDKSYVLDGCSADLIVVVAREAVGNDADGMSLFAVAPDSPGLSARPLETIDLTRKLAHLHFDNVPARRIGRAGMATAGLRATMDYALIAHANEMVGGADALLHAALDYAKLRMQFGRPIGSFQAIKHKLADLLLDVELAKSAAYYAAAALAENDPQTAALASLAQASASDVAIHTAEQCVQIHGGIGFTWDHDTHLWFKRAKSSEVLFGDACEHRERYLQQVAT